MSAIMEPEVLDYPWFLTMRLFEKTPPCVTIRGGTIIGRAVPVQLPENKRPTLRIHPSETEHMKFERHCLTHRREAEAAAGEKWGREYHDAVVTGDVRYEIDSPFDDPADATVITDDNVEAVRVLRGHGIHVIDNYLTGEECEELIATFEPAQLEQGGIGADEWNGRISFEEYPEHLKYKMTEGRVKVAEKIYSEALIIDNPHLALWREGNSKLPHSDFGTHNEYLWREYTSIIYLNDDFSGGCLTFPDIGVSATFDGGTLVIFEGGVMKHGIEKVTRGYKYTAPCWFAKTKWKAHLDRIDRERAATPE